MNSTQLAGPAEWQAVVSRNPGFDGAFVFAVRTTGIYCRPSCPSRRPKYENVVLFSVPELAEEAGFRACLRCRPNESVSDDAVVALVRDACRFILQHRVGVPSGDELAGAMGVSRAHLQRAFKKVLGVTPWAYADVVRLSEFKKKLRDGKTVAEAVCESG
ncbi:MAG: methylphosphotriester-DNA--protein-cysteine methyltransferase family protein [SAR202 cluster bacterium]|nr:methylphosphotriester-DNA--protein-cysteine methyltransferase family protein [SAR202 cluster bacterium]